MSTLYVDDVAGQGGGSSTNLMSGLAKAWATFNGTGTAAIIDSFNASSLTDNGTGDFDVNFTNSFDAGGYSTSGNQAYNTSITNYIYLTQPRNSGTVLAGSIGVYQKFVGTSAAGLGDYHYGSITAHGDLA